LVACLQGNRPSVTAIGGCFVKNEDGLQKPNF